MSTGKTYRVKMSLERSAGLSPAWLVGAVRASYPGAEVASVESYNDSTATVLVRWSGPSAALNIGDSVSPSVQGLQLPVEALPVGRVQSAQQADDAPGSVQSSIDKMDTKQAVVTRLLLSGAILATVWYFSSRIKSSRRQ